jgi:hypothetical protein
VRGRNGRDRRQACRRDDQARRKSVSRFHVSAFPNPSVAVNDFT